MAESPLAGVPLPAGVSEVPFLTQTSIRTSSPPAGFPAPGRSRDLTLLGLGPDEWLALGSPPVAEGATTVDVSAQRTTVDLEMPHVRELLAFGCALDLHPRVFAVGDCAQTTLAHCPVILLRRESGFRVLVRVSFAVHLAAWLTDAALGSENFGPHC